MMFGLCGVTRSELDFATVATRGADYAALASATDTTANTTKTAIANVMAQNSGPGADGFRASAGEVAEHFAELASAAGRTAAAYRDAGQAGGSTQVAMAAVNADATQAYWRGLAKGATPHELGLLIQVTRDELLRLESAGVAKIKEAFADLDLPEKMEVSAEDKYGRLDPRIADKWRELSDEQRKQVLQKMADAYADAHGYPRIEITFEAMSSGSGITWGDYRDSPSARLRINSDELDDPIMINTIAHEMEHRGQYQGMGFRWPWQDERAGMSREDAERWKQLNADHVRQRGGPDFWDYYPPRPVEVHAREAGREFVNAMTYEDFMEYL